MDFKKLGFMPADIMLPKEDFESWSVVACDQYTSEGEYWEEVEKITDGKKSTLNLVFPEIYLGEDKNSRIEKINMTMKQYIDEDTFDVLQNSFVYVERTLASGNIRKGLIGAIDLEMYDYSEKAVAPVRATEKTVLERIPPRVEIRKGACLELPHVMLLMNDETDEVIKSAENSKGEKLYDFELMMNGGRIRGFKVSPNKEIYNALSKLWDKGSNAVYVVGDGNHSLATAKECWNMIKCTLTDEEKENHPARYALVELNNIHSSAIEFEPIHRVVFNCNSDDLLERLKQLQGCCEHTLTYVTKEAKELITFNSPFSLTVAALQDFLDKYIKENNLEIDYIHGVESTCKVACGGNNSGFILPDVDKSGLFDGVAKDGSLPRKTFSIGHAFEKRYYLEARKIK